MGSLLGKVIRVAHRHPETRKYLLPLIKQAMEFPSEEALEEYLKNHPGADRSKHRVVKEGDPPWSGEQRARRELKVRQEMEDAKPGAGWSKSYFASQAGGK